jgi:glycosyltransferase involved in cell wall biosynthesis
MKPKVSIIIPYFKDRGFLSQAIDSVMAQTYQNIELIISQSPGNVSTNLNAGIEKSTGELIKYLCDDDLLPNDSIELSVGAFEDPAIDFIHGQALNFWPYINATEVYSPKVLLPDLKSLLNHNHIHGGSLMYRRRVFYLFGNFDTSLWTGEEYEFNLRILSKGAKIGFCKNVLYHYRHHPLQKSIGDFSSDYQYKRKVAIELIKSKYLDQNASV